MRELSKTNQEEVAKEMKRWGKKRVYVSKAGGGGGVQESDNLDEGSDKQRRDADLITNARVSAQQGGDSLGTIPIEVLAHDKRGWEIGVAAGN